jgi:hypothetical protein
MHHGMDKKDDKHAWTIAKTTNVKNDLDLVFRWSLAMQTFRLSSIPSFGFFEQD